MKTSNKILVIFIGILAMFYLTYAIDARFLGEEKKDMKHYALPISNFKHLKLENIRGLELEHANTTLLKVGHYGDSIKTALNITYKGDTLILNRPVEAKTFYGYYKLFVSHNINTINAKNSWVNLKNYSADTIDVKLDPDSEIKKLDKSHFKFIKITTPTKQ
jgi:hypothetical protein